MNPLAASEIMMGLPNKQVSKPDVLLASAGSEDISQKSRHRVFSSQRIGKRLATWIGVLMLLGNIQMVVWAETVEMLLEDRFEYDVLGERAMWAPRGELSGASSVEVSNEKASPWEGGENSLRIFRREEDRFWITKAFQPSTWGSLRIRLDFLADENAVHSDNNTGFIVMGQPGPDQEGWVPVVRFDIENGRIGYISDRMERGRPVLEGLVEIQPDRWYRLELVLERLNEGIPESIRVSIASSDTPSDTPQEIVKEVVPVYLEPGQILAIDRLVVRGGSGGAAQTLHLDNIEVAWVSESFPSEESRSD